MNAPARLLDRPERLRLSVDNFLLLNDSGAFDDYTKSELIDGDIYVMNSQLARHARAKSELAVELALALRTSGRDLGAISEVSVRVAPDSLPEPDIVLTSFRGDREVPAETVALVIEVSDTTLATDLGRKAELYAAAGIPEYWVVDLNGQRVITHARPSGSAYAERGEVAFGEPLLSAAIEGLQVPTVGLLG